MAKDYAKLCPILENHIPEATLQTDLAPKEAVAKAKPSLTKAKVEQAYALLLVDPQYTSIALATGLLASQVKKLHGEMTAYKGWSEEE
jgi:hypothetical protein|tara:strand:- start:256 stop:519 length:264 start_codon:yes stop_codon:yes gene_type:complete